MRNIIKADLYRIFQSKGVYITLAIFLVLIYTPFGTITIEESDPDAPQITVEETDSVLRFPTGREAPREFAGTSDNVVYFMLPFICSVIAADFSSGAIKNHLAGGVSRRRYFAAKLLILAGICTTLFFTRLVVATLVSTAVMGFDGSFDREFLLETAGIYLPQFLLCLAFVYLGAFIIFAFRKTSTLNALYLCTALLPGTFLLIFSLISDRFKPLFYADLIFNINTFAVGGAPPNLPRSLIVAVTYIIACIWGGYAIFKKAEIK